ncbi:MAG: tRNA pseudouridine(54/55) synthase Pus10 [Euryarchaeota archaeon]|nr:tRNA pseudouridine(54/55) synthase Pus10 [Euryarchaeota archaeon]
MERELLAPKVIEAVSKLPASTLCDRCLGRRFGKVEHGLSNPERGRAIREDTSVPSGPSEPDCGNCEGVYLAVREFVDAGKRALAGLEFRNLLIGTRLSNAFADREAALDAITPEETREAATSEMNREIGKRLSIELGKDVEFKKPDVTVIIDTRFAHATAEISPIFVYARYRKLVRGIPQTRWPCSNCKGTGCLECAFTGRQYPTSVQDIVAGPFVRLSQATDNDFHGMGREDIDARCLGRGRPFILELRSPRVRSIDLAAAASEVNRSGSVEIEGLRFAARAEVAAVKESRAVKTYRAKVLFDSPPDGERFLKVVAALRGRAIAQRTPQRVTARRSDLVRSRTVLDMSVESLAGPEATVVIKGDAGLYIKELVSGDDGRTRPSLSELMDSQARVVELDVVDVEDQETVKTT